VKLGVDKNPPRNAGRAARAAARSPGGGGPREPALFRYQRYDMRTKNVFALYGSLA